MNPIQKVLFPKGSQPTSAEVRGLLNKWTHQEKVKRFDFLIQKGDRESHLYFIRKGTMRIFYIIHNTIEMML